MSRQLTEKEERLLMRFLDGECGLFDRRRAEKLVGNVPAAEEFVSSFKLMREDYKREFESTQVASVNLWSGIEQRIEAEKRAEIFLGRREAPQNLGGRLREWISVPWAVNLSGAAVTAVVLMLVVAMRDGGEQMVRVAPRGASGQELASAAHGRPQIIEDREPNVFDVDWMRSDGRLNIINNRDERSAIIWVQRRAHGLVAKPRRAPEMALLDEATPFVVPGGVDSSGVSGSGALLERSGR